MHRIRGMSGEPAGLTEAGVRWAAIIVFAAVTAVGVIPLNPNAPAAVAGAFVAVGAAVPLVLRWRPALLYAAVATAGIAVLGDGRSRHIGWVAVCPLTRGGVLAARRREGPGYLAPPVGLFT